MNFSFVIAPLVGAMLGWGAGRVEWCHHCTASGMASFSGSLPPGFLAEVVNGTKYDGQCDTPSDCGKVPCSWTGTFQITNNSQMKATDAHISLDTVLKSESKELGLGGVRKWETTDADHPKAICNAGGTATVVGFYVTYTNSEGQSVTEHKDLTLSCSECGP